MGNSSRGHEVLSSCVEKHLVEDDILFTNHLVGKWEILAEVMKCYPSV